VLGIHRYSRNGDSDYLETLALSVDVSRSQRVDFSSTMQVHRSALEERLELEGSGTLEGSSMLRVPNVPVATAGATGVRDVDTENATTANTSISINVTSTSINVGVVAGLAAGVSAPGGENEGEDDGSQSSRSRRSRDFQLV
jgi:hypothetical protein